MLFIFMQLIAHFGFAGRMWNLVVLLIDSPFYMYVDASLVDLLVDLLKCYLMKYTDGGHTCTCI